MNDELIPIEDDKQLGRCTALDKQIRLDEVVDMMGKLYSTNEIQKFMMEKYGVAKKTTEDYLREARDIIISTIPSPQEIIGKHIKTYERIARRNEGIDDRTSMIATASIEKLLKLHVPDIQVNNNTLNVQMDGVDLQDILQAVKQLKEIE
jgi:hypothetical protein